MADLAADAHAYAERGWFVFPCDGKQPLVPWRDRSTIDPEQIDAWWAREFPNANIGIDCEPSRLVVIDIDDRLSLANLSADVGFDLEQADTLIGRTGSGGLHVIFEADPNLEVRNSQSKLAPGIDVRGAGGYIVVPPSLHPSGTRYEWVKRRPPAPLPRTLADLAKPPPIPERPVQEPAGQANDAWGQRILEAEIVRVMDAVEGTRNGELFAAACKVFQAVKGGHIDEQVARARLTNVATLKGLTATETARTLDSAWLRVDPRNPEERADVGPTLVVPPPADADELDDGQERFDVLTLEQLAAMPPPAYLLDRKIPEGLTFLVGQPKVGKSFIALDWAATVAATGVPVLYFIGEGVRGFAQRVVAWSKANPYADLTTFGIIPRAPQLLNPAQVQMLYGTVRRRRPALCVFDTWSRCTVGADENSHADTSRAIDVLDQLRNAYGTSSLVVHHTNASGARARGHTSIDGSVEAEWKVERDEELPDAYQLWCSAMKDDVTPPSILGRVKAHGESAVAHPSAYQPGLP